jgi:nucleotidyltransferase substrate binding protein (TIGR01987 family)
MIDTASLGRAIAQLEQALAFSASALARSDVDLGRHLRAGAIQAFEFTYELSYKTLKRFLIDSEPSPDEVQRLDFNGTIRLGYARGLLAEEIAAWRQFREDRSMTNHTYDGSKARSVFAGIPRFLAEARFLLARVGERQAA